MPWPSTRFDVCIGRVEVVGMLERVIPSSGERLPAIGMGTWRTFDPPAITNAALAPIEATVAAFVEAGGHVIDTSPMYGKSEKVVGRVTGNLAVNRELFLATKVWTTGRDAGIRQMEESMRLLGREQLDLMQIHNLVDWRTHLPILREWKASGRVRYIGITHYEPSAYGSLASVIEREPIDFVQLAYSVTVRDAADRVLPLAQDRGVAVIVNRPFEGGELLSRLARQPVPAFARELGTSWGEVLLRFVLAHPAVTCVIPATSSVDHLRDNLRAGEGRLPTPAECEQLIELCGV
jgi:diketogulonate reductase-like aldo/keto reductase